MGAEWSVEKNCAGGEVRWAGCGAGRVTWAGPLASVDVGGRTVAGSGIGRGTGRPRGP